MRALVFLLVISGAAQVSWAAPAPGVKEKKKAPDITAGEYHYKWADQTNNMTLSKNGEYHAEWMGLNYYGFWRWNSKTRQIEIWEACDDGAKGRMEVGDYRDMTYYIFKLENDLEVAKPEGHLLWIKAGKIETPMWWLDA